MSNYVDCIRWRINILISEWLKYSTSRNKCRDMCLCLLTGMKLCSCRSFCHLVLVYFVFEFPLLCCRSVACRYFTTDERGTKGVQKRAEARRAPESRTIRVSTTRGIRDSGVDGSGGGGGGARPIPVNRRDTRNVLLVAHGVRQQPIADLPGKHRRVLALIFADGVDHARRRHFGLAAADHARLDRARLVVPTTTRTRAPHGQQVRRDGRKGAAAALTYSPS